MTTPSAHLGLPLPSTTDGFTTAGLDALYAILDKSPGIWLGTHAQRLALTWGANQTGMYAQETDAPGLLYRWDGSAWTRPFPSGWQGGNTRTSDFVATASFTTVVSVGGIYVNGDRTIQITASWNKADNGSGALGEWQLLRGVTGIGSWQQNVQGGSYVAYDNRAHLYVTAGIYTYALQYRSVGGTSTLRADGSHPISIDVVEV